MIHIYYGYGKGKTSSAVGAGMRAKGAGMSVALVQFLKDNKSSELKAVPFDILKSPDTLAFNPGSSYTDWVKSALEYIKSSDADMIILDEFLDVTGDFVKPEEVLDILTLFKDKEVIITGHRKVDFLFDRADYITFFEKIKHPFDNGISAREGIEY